jgi:hypothetical protein
MAMMAVCRGSKCLGGACFPTGGKRRPQGLLGSLRPPASRIGCACRVRITGHEAGVSWGSRLSQGPRGIELVPLGVSAPKKPLPTKTEESRRFALARCAAQLRGPLGIALSAA